MKFGLSGCGGGLESAPPERLLSFAQQAEALGFSALWFNEEHFQRPTNGYGRLCLSPLILAAMVAGRTARIRLGFSVLLLPLHHPLRLAEEVATLDLLSGGRVDFGISRGGNPQYLHAYGAEPTNGREQFQESLSFILHCWTHDEVRVRDATYCIEPKPMQRPHPPVYIGTYSEDGARWAGLSGHGLIQHGIQSLANVQLFLHVYAAAGGNIKEVPVGRFLYVSESDEAAKRELMPVIYELTARLRKRGLGGRPGVMSEGDLDPQRFYSEMVIAGSPKTCADRIAVLQGTCGIQYVNCLAAFFGLLPEDFLRRSLKLFAAEVMPQFIG